MRAYLFLLLLTSSYPLLAQSKPTAYSVFVQLNDTDCDSGRFKSRLERELKGRGLTLADNANRADLLLLVALEYGSRPVELWTTTLNVSLNVPGRPPFKKSTDWRSTSEKDETAELALGTIADDISEMGKYQRIKIGNVEGLERVALEKFLRNKGYLPVTEDPDLDVEVDLQRKLTHDTEDFAAARYQLQRVQDGAVLGSGNITKSDPHMYAEPLDVLASAAMQVAKAVPLTPSRTTSRR